METLAEVDVTRAFNPVGCLARIQQLEAENAGLRERITVLEWER
jgi:hypothetical protein